MDVILTDQEIHALLEERKSLPADYSQKMVIRPKRGHKERERDVKGSEGSDFRIILRQSLFNPLDVSVILSYRPAQSNQLFRLKRCNGKSHQHTNPIEGNMFYDFHIHHATERYQQLGAREDSYAEPSKRFSDIGGAINCLISNCGFELPSGSQRSLFEEM